MKKIVLTAGGTAGHVTPNIALFPALREANFEIHYIGSYEGIEKRLIEDYEIQIYYFFSQKKSPTPREPLRQTQSSQLRLPIHHIRFFLIHTGISPKQSFNILIIISDYDHSFWIIRLFRTHMFYPSLPIIPQIVKAQAILLWIDQPDKIIFQL